ncbi:MAG: hypothetical protein WBA31_00035 [Candidatus Dormiibacterota bacterium]
MDGHAGPAPEEKRAAHDGWMHEHHARLRELRRAWYQRRRDVILEQQRQALTESTAPLANHPIVTTSRRYALRPVERYDSQYPKWGPFPDALDASPRPLTIVGGSQVRATWLRLSTLAAASAILGTAITLAIGGGVSAAARSAPTVSQPGGATVVKQAGPDGSSSTAYYGVPGSTLARAQLNAEQEGLSGAATASILNASDASAPSATPDSYVYQYVQLDVCPVAGCLVEDVLKGYWEYNGSYAYEESVTGGCSYTIGWYCSTIHTVNLISQAPPAPYVEKYGSYNLGVTCIPYLGLGGCVSHLVVELYIYGYPSGAHSTYWDEY